MKRDLFLLRSIAVCILMLLMPLLSFAADTIRVNIPRVTVTMARSYNFSSAANSVYVPVEFNSAMSADKVADYIEESNAFLFDHYGEDVATDEDGKVFTTYKDVAGRLIMEKRGTDSKTYYVYDDRGFLSWVITPAGSTLLSSSANWSKTSTNAVNHCYVYSYDAGGNMVYDGSGSVVERNDYYPLGMRTATGNSYPQLATNLYKYNGKEVQTVGSLGFTDYGARMYDDFTGRWFVPDPLAEKYASMSPYMYCGGNPVMYVDTDGKEPRIFVETKGVGHAFVTVGSGDNTIVYTYGRYGELGKNKSFARSTTPTGEGILIRLSGERAKEFIKGQMIEKGAKAYEFKDGSDDAVMKYYDDLFYSSDKIPKVGKYAGDSDARVINTYNLFNNNCVTTSIDGIKAGSKESIDLKWLMCPDNLEFVLSNKVERANSNVITIEYEDLKKELNLKNGAGGSW